MTTTDSAAEPAPLREAGLSTPEDVPLSVTPSEENTEKRTKRPHGRLVAIVLLSLALGAAAAALTLNLIKLDEATTRIGEQDRQLEEQRQLIEKKETFGAAMRAFMDTATEFDGVLMGSLVPLDRYQIVASQAWAHRWNPKGLDRDIATVRDGTQELDALLAAAISEAATNDTNSTYEAVTDQLGKGFVASVIDDADALCDDDVLACVTSDDALTVHFDAADDSAPYMTDWLRTGVAYHEFAHVLQMTNPEPTETALASFRGDSETMADCFALTYLDGWTLDHRIWTSSYEYWDVNIGYGHVCNEVQKQAVRDWYGQLAFQAGTITQQG